jgi:uncharacterized delta-60 repeat protein
MKTSYVLAVAALAVLAGASLAAAGRGSFGPQLTEKAAETPQVSIDIANSLAFARDGKLVVAGLSRKGGRYAWALARYGVGGRLDPSFGQGGSVLAEFGTGVVANAVTARADGKILVAGDVALAGHDHTEFVLARYTDHGRPDPSFGTGGTVFDPGSAANAVATQPDGKIIVAGSSAGGLALVRYTDRGRLDPSFGTGGKVVTALGSSRAVWARAIALQPDGKIVAAGGIDMGGHGYFAIARFTADGKLDPSFGHDGWAITAISWWGDAYGVVFQADGKLVVAGMGGDQYALARYTADGKLDPSFGSGGTVLTTLEAGSHALAIQHDGKIVAAGSISGPDSNYAPSFNFAFARYTSSGSLDPSFGRGGMVLTKFRSGAANLRSGAAADAVAVEPDGKLVAVGSFVGDFALARSTSRGSLDPSFGRGGMVATPFGRLWRTKLASLSATRVSSGVLIRWRTTSEFDARGFYVYREQSGGKQRVNRALIRANGTGRGAAYSFRDRVAPRSTRRYLLQEVTVDDSARWLGQVTVRR